MKRGVLRRTPWLARLLLAAHSGAALAVTGVNPDGVNVNAAGATTVFLTFQNLGPAEVAVDAFWCGEVVATGVTDSDPCVPGTLFGRLPLRNDLSRPSGTAGVLNLTDIMTIPPSVARRAYQDAQLGGDAFFFYVRRFTDGSLDTFVTVTCRLSGGGARVPLALTEVRLALDTPEDERPVYFLSRGERLPPFSARITYNGAGRLTGRWEVVAPGDIEPTSEDLLTEASLPVEQRGLQRRYTLIDRFDLFLPPTGSLLLRGPDPALVEAEADGPYKILLRIEATHEREGNSNTLAGTVPSGGVAGFPMPVLRFFVGNPEALAATQEAPSRGVLSVLMPGENAEVESGRAVSFSWVNRPDAAGYALEIVGAAGELLTAVVPAGVAGYTTPPWALGPAGQRVHWRIVALDGSGRRIDRSDWRSLRVKGGP